MTVHDAAASVYDSLDQKQKSAIASILERSDDNVRQVYLGYESMFKLLDGNWRDTAHYDPAANGVRLNLSEVFAPDGKRPQGTTWFHEFGHMVDSLSGNISETYKGGAFARSIQSAVNAYIDARNKQLRDGFEKAVAAKDTDWLVANGYMSSWKAEYIRENPDMEKAMLAALRHTKTYAYRTVADEIRHMDDAQKADVSDLFGGLRFASATMVGAIRRHTGDRGGRKKVTSSSRWRMRASQSSSAPTRRTQNHVKCCGNTCLNQVKYSMR